jgi:hypothetical protein
MTARDGFTILCTQQNSLVELKLISTSNQQIHSTQYKRNSIAIIKHISIYSSTEQESEFMQHETVYLIVP